MRDLTEFAPLFDIGDTIWVLRGNQPHRQFRVCTGCEGQGVFHIATVRRGLVTCPDCRGTGRDWLDSEVRFYNLDEYTVGQVQVTITTAEQWSRDEATQVGEGQWRTVRYMARESGVGSGSVYREEHCLATKAEAVAFAAQQGWVTEAIAKSPTFHATDDGEGEDWRDWHDDQKAQEEDARARAGFGGGGL